MECSHYAIIGFASDVEGNLEYWNNYVNSSRVLERRHGRLFLKDNCQFVYGGDVCDRGSGDIRLLTELVDLKRRYFNRVHFIMGNRDTNKMRWPVTLHPYILSRKPETYWFKNPDPNVLAGYRLHNRVDKMKWVLRNNMGSPLSFEYRRQELQDLGLPSDDESVVDSYLKLIEPDGLLTEYLELAKICVVIGDVVFVHGAFHEYNMGWVPNAAVQGEYTMRISAHRFVEENRMCGGCFIDSLKDWAECINDFAHREVLDFKHNMVAYVKHLDELWLHSADRNASVADPSMPLTELTASASEIPEQWEAQGGYLHPQPGTRLIQYGQGWMPDASLNLGVIYTNYLQDGRPLEDIGEGLRRWLRDSGVTKVIVGHQPNGDAPLVIRCECEDGVNIHILSGDTSYSRNTHYRTVNLRHRAPQDFVMTIPASSDDKPDEWMSLDMYLTTVCGQPPLGPVTETRHPDCISEVLVTWPLASLVFDHDSCGSADIAVPSTVVVYGRLSQGAMYSFRLSNTNNDSGEMHKYLGKKTKDNWHIKAYGVVRSCEESAVFFESVLNTAMEMRTADSNKYYLLIYGEHHLFKHKFIPEHLIDLEF